MNTSINIIPTLHFMERVQNRKLELSFVEEVKRYFLSNKIEKNRKIRMVLGKYEVVFIKVAPKTIVLVTAWKRGQK